MTAWSSLLQRKGLARHIHCQARDGIVVYKAKLCDMKNWPLLHTDVWSSGKYVMRAIGRRTGRESIEALAWTWCGLDARPSSSRTTRATSEAIDWIWPRMHTSSWLYKHARVCNGDPHHTHSDAMK